jgi:hypothetical protein
MIHYPLLPSPIPSSAPTALRLVGVVTEERARLRLVLKLLAHSLLTGTYSVLRVVPSQKHVLHRGLGFLASAVASGHLQRGPPPPPTSGAPSFSSSWPPSSTSISYVGRTSLPLRPPSLGPHNSRMHSRPRRLGSTRGSRRRRGAGRGRGGAAGGATGGGCRAQDEWVSVHRAPYLGHSLIVLQNGSPVCGIGWRDMDELHIHL